MIDVADPFGTRVLARRSLERLRARRAAPPGQGSDAGFTLVELIVTMVIIGGVLLGLMAMQTAAMVGTGKARQRQQASAVGNGVMEQLRGLPWATLSKGLNSNFAVAAGGDTNVSGGRLRPSSSRSLDEALITSGTQATNVRPLSGTGGSNLSEVTDPAVPGFVFTARSYVSKAAGDATGTVQLTVIVTWRAVQDSAATKSQVIVRSQAYAPNGGCGNTSTQPFLGACQAFFDAEAGVNGASTTIQSTLMQNGAQPTGGEGILPQSATKTASIVPEQASSKIVSSQISNADSSATIAGTTLSSSSSSDVGASSTIPTHHSVTGSATATGATVTGTASSLTLVPSSGQTLTAQTSADGTTCPGPTPAGQPCADGRFTGGSNASVSLTTGGANLSLLSQATSGTPWVARVTRFLTVGGTSALGCSTISASGCISAQANRSFGTITAGGFAWSKNSNGTAWGGTAAYGLAQVTGYSDSSLSEYGASSLNTAATVTRAGTIRYWNGTAYQTLALTATLNTSVTTGTVTWTGGGSTLTSFAKITVRPYTAVRTNTDATCVADACSLDADMSSLTMTVNYELADATGLTSAFTVTTDLGSNRAATSFKAAPSA